MELGQKISFFISTPSRHPANQNGYDSIKHVYKKDYVNPKFYELILFVTFRGFGETSSGKPIIPPNILSIEWSISLGSTFRKSFTRKRSPGMVLTKARVPAPGNYQINIKANFTDNSSVSQSLNYRIRDFLVIGVGDSFSSGQGNPDVPAVPSTDQKLICRATSILLAMTRLEAMVKKFAEELADQTKEKVSKYLPFAGKILVAEINQVQNAVGFVKSNISDLKDWVVQIGRKVAAKLVEGVEELFSKIGIGDGGDSAETDPHPAAWQEPFAYRSYRSGQSLGACQAENQNSRGADRITFLPFGRTGSEIDSGLLGPRTVGQLLTDRNDSIDVWINNMGQIAEAKKTVGMRHIDALIITIGVNDLGFSTLVTNSILKASGEKRKNRIRGARNKVANIFPAQLDELKKVIESELRPGKVFITEYPVGIFQEIADGAKPCGILGSTVPNLATMEGFNLDQSDAQDLGEVGQELNNKIREKAQEFGWVLITGIAAGFKSHGYCARKTYFVSAEESCLNQGDFEGMLHPNARGHELTRDCIAEALRTELFTQKESWLEPVLHLMMR